MTVYHRYQYLKALYKRKKTKLDPHLKTMILTRQKKLVHTIVTYLIAYIPKALLHGGGRVFRKWQQGGKRLVFNQLISLVPATQKIR